MRFTKPSWLNHRGDKKDYEVYSCHVSHDGKRLVTAAGDGHVRVWSTEAILNARDPNYKGPTQLAAMSYHSGTIHSVRFSPNDAYLASGADDKIVCIYTLDPNPPSHTTFGSNETPPVENWRIYRRLIGHDNDVQDLAWSHDSSVLVSVGLDSKVVIWSGFTFEKLKTISLHQSHVKGITFDPANKFFATASDDRTLKVFRFNPPDAKSTAYDQTNNFTLETSVESPFDTSPLTTYFRRPSWSPDGAHLAAANAVNGPVTCVTIINRSSWRTDISFIGHEAPVEVCAFSPRTYSSEVPNPTDTAQLGVPVVACAGQDKALSVWKTNSASPFVITQELAAKTITDLAWAPDGEVLYITSLDGTIAACVFEANELGYPVPRQAIEKTLSKYGGSRRAGILETTDALILEENSKADEIKVAQGRMGALMGDAKEMTPTPVNGNGSAKATNGVSHNSSEQSSKDVTLKDVAPAAVPAVVPVPQADRIVQLKQRVTITKDGKKRIAPFLISSSAGLSESTLPRSQLVASTVPAAANDTPQHILDLSKPYDALPKGGLASLLLGNKRKFAEIEGDEERRAEKKLQEISHTGATPIVRNTTDGVVPPIVAPKPSIEIPDVLRPAMINPSLTVATVRLSVPQVRGTITRPLAEDPVHDSGATSEAAKHSDNDTSQSIVFEAKNAMGPARTGRPQDRQPTRISVSRRGQLIWQDYLPRACSLAVGNYNFWCAACEDGTIYVWTPAGRRLLNAMVLEAQPVILDCRGWWLLCITAVGQCYVWNIKTLSSPHPPISMAPILDSAAAPQQTHLVASPSIMFARLNSQGCVAVGTSNGEGYTYSPKMYTWLRLSEPWWAVGSQYWNTMDTSVAPLSSLSSVHGASAAIDEIGITEEQISAGIIPLLERNTTTQALIKGRTYYLQRLVKSLLSAEGYEGFEAAVSIAHLENRIAAAMALGARAEFRLYLIMYAKRLGAEGSKAKAEELLKSLVGSMYVDESTDEVNHSDAPEVLAKGWQSAGETIVGWRRDELAKEILLLLGKYRELQRITVPYGRLLGVLNAPNGVEDTSMTG